MTKHTHTPGPWQVRPPHTGAHSPTVFGNGDQIATAWTLAPRRNIDQPATIPSAANASLIAAAPLLEMISEIAGTLVWASMSEHHRAALTESRKCDILSAYRAYCGFRDGRMTMDDAWTEVSAIQSKYEMGA